MYSLHSVHSVRCKCTRCTRCAASALGVLGALGALQVDSVHSVRCKCTRCTRCTQCAASALGAVHSVHSVRALCAVTDCGRNGNSARCTRCAHCAQSLIAAAMGNWLANYGYGHLLPHVNLRTAGLFGTLLVTPEAIRFLALPEILMLVGALVPCWLPAEHRAAVRMLGNGISTRNLQWNCFSSGSDAS